MSAVLDDFLEQHPHPPRRNGAQDVAALRRVIQPLQGDGSRYDRLLARIGDARLVLIGEASHGTHEFYRERAAITHRLIVEKGFHAVAVEADWPDAYRVNRYVRGLSNDHRANDALGDFRRFPTWMWRNTDVLAFIDWLRSHNDAVELPERVGFYGLDLYSMHASMAAVLEHLDRTDPEAALRARQRYACFDHYGEDPQAYGYAASIDLARSCEDEVVAQLIEMRVQSHRRLAHDGHVASDEAFFAEQNARLVRNAEAYYRAIFHGRISSWNLRDRHMMETLEALAAHLGDAAAPAKIVVWAHNSHLGDARATELGAAGELNLGQFVRVVHPQESFLVGFSTYSGTVTAAYDWDGLAQRMAVRPGLPGSYEELFHNVLEPDFLLDLARDGAGADAVRSPRLQRAIGVIYRPQTERQSHYFRSRLAAQFDALLHFDDTRALRPLELNAGWHNGDLPDTYPSGM